MPFTLETKRWSWRTLALALAGVIAVGLNADTFHVVGQLWSDGALRAAVVAGAQVYRDDHDPPAPATSAVSPTRGNTRPVTTTREVLAADEPATVDDVLTGADQLRADIKKLRDVKFPVGWSDRRPASPDEWLLMLLGWLVTAFAVSLGSNFWFDVLSKALQLRGGGPRVSPATGRIDRAEG